MSAVGACDEPLGRRASGQAVSVDGHGARHPDPRVSAARFALRPDRGRLRRLLHRRSRAAPRGGIRAGARPRRPGPPGRAAARRAAAGAGSIQARPTTWAPTCGPWPARAASSRASRSVSSTRSRRISTCASPRATEEVPRGTPQARRGAGRHRPAGRPDGCLSVGGGDPARAAGGVHRRVLQCAARPGARRVPAARHRNRRLRGGHRQTVVGLQLLPGRLPLHGGGQRRPQTADVEPAAAGGPRVLSRPSHRALPQGSGPGRTAAARPSRPSSWSTRRSA